METHAPGLCAGEQLLELFGGVVHRVRRDQRAVAALMAAAPRDQLCHVIAGYLGQELVLAEEVNQVADQALGVVGAGMVLTDFEPVPAGDVIKP